MDKINPKLEQLFSIKNELKKETHTKKKCALNKQLCNFIVKNGTKQMKKTP